MVDRGSRWAIVASLTWVVLAAFAILGTHVDVVAQLGSGDMAAELWEAPALVAPHAQALPPREC